MVGSPLLPLLPCCSGLEQRQHCAYPVSDKMKTASMHTPATLLARQGVSFCLGLGLQLALIDRTAMALESVDYETTPGATVAETGDRVPGGYRVMPVSAIFTFDLTAAQPALTAHIADAVLEGGNPLPLTVRSSSGSQLPDGTYRFTGDYMKELHPSGTQYLFDWRFSTATDGRVVWNGITGWAGGHIWHVTMTNLTIAPRARLTMSQLGNESVLIAWATNFADHVLECATSVPASGWSTVTNAVDTNGNRCFVTVTAERSERFFRLREP